ncbi:MAG: pectin acetylesterase-family hydrolase [Polyangiales bacterium]
MFRASDSALLLGLLASLGCADQPPPLAAADASVRVSGEAPAGTEHEPLPYRNRQWEWIAFSGTTCRDGSPAGLSLNADTQATRIVLYLEGGGSCYDAETCASNPAQVSAPFPLPFGIFDRSHPHNPVRDWTFVYVPYCSGDLHIGEADNVSVEGVDGPQLFTGRRNLVRFLERLKPTFPAAEQVLLTGVSAGGLGAILDLDLVQAFFAPVPVTMIDDSGPVLSTAHVPACLNQRRRRYWGLDQTVLAACGGDCDPDDDFLLQAARRNVQHARAATGFIHSNHDEVIRSFLGIATNNGLNDCGGTLNLTPTAPDVLEAALLDTRSQLSAASPSFGTFFPASTQHGWITTPAFYTQTVGGVLLVDWFGHVIAAAPAQQLGP